MQSAVKAESDPQIVPQIIGIAQNGLENPPAWDMKQGNIRAVSTSFNSSQPPQTDQVFPKLTKTKPLSGARQARKSCAKEHLSN
jgi:hypothetical protein